MLDDLIKERIKKVSELRTLGIEPYPEKSSRQFTLGEVLAHFPSWSKTKKKIIIAGRVRALRGHGGVIFCDLKDETGKLQLVLKEDILSQEQLKFFEKYIDLGDFLEAQGSLFATQRGEKSLLVKKFTLLAKSLRPLPTEWFGLEDTEERFRKRYLDLLENEEVRTRFSWRSKIISEIRNFLNQRGYLEVETPILQTVYGGANAQPFLTKLEALNLKLYLRIAPELYLKRLLIGGFENIYEIGKNFRNEGIDREHNPEFTMLELYSAYRTRDDLMKLLEELIKHLVRQMKNYQDNTNLLKQNWLKIDFEDFLNKKTGLNFTDTQEAWLKKAQEVGVEHSSSSASKEKLADEIFKKLRGEIKAPTFIINQPVAISPLAKQNSQEPSKTLRFELILNGWEIANGFSELNDPLEQRKRFEAQAKLRAQGEAETHPQDQDFLEALEYGMPPAAGLGIGLDRLVAVLTQASSLKEVILFPFMKPKQ
ncbi:MAG: lysyl-tRNA synthetase, class [Patescibacteria group bacterium]|nr:lysyl-tRNA synthetase, class [Patescibacteria group bacterium]